MTSNKKLSFGGFSLIIVLAILPFSRQSCDLTNLPPEGQMSPCQLTTSKGFPFERHRVVTDDGYVITMHRLPGNSRKRRRRKIPVLLMHGLMLSSSVWLLDSKKENLAFKLHDQGFDVWVGNHRGNEFGRAHVTLDPDKDAEKFWDFSFDEMGKFDVPALVDHVLNVTKSKKVSFVGHSQGCVVLLSAAIQRPGFGGKISEAYFLGPAAYVAHTRSSLADMGCFVRWVARYVYPDEFKGDVLQYVGSYCSHWLFSGICSHLIGNAAGFSRLFSLVDFLSVCKE